MPKTHQLHVWPMANNFADLQQTLSLVHPHPQSSLWHAQQTNLDWSLEIGNDSRPVCQQQTLGLTSLQLVRPWVICQSWEEQSIAVVLLLCSVRDTMVRPAPVRHWPCHPSPHRLQSCLRPPPHQRSSLGGSLDHPRSLQLPMPACWPTNSS